MDVTWLSLFSRQNGLLSNALVLLATSIEELGQDCEMTVLHLKLDVNRCIFVCAHVGTLARLFILQTSKEQTQEASECVAIFWVPLYFCNTQLLQSTNSVSILVPCCIDFRSWARTVNL